MIMEIGFTAGDILHILEQGDHQTVDQLVRKSGKDRTLILMALGWLAREGHVTVEGELDRAVIVLNRKKG